MTFKDLPFPIKNPKKRVLSSFMAEQLLYEYAVKTLDEKREKAVSESLQNSPALSKSLDDIIYGMTYCHHLQKTTVTQEYLNKFKYPLSREKRFRNFFNPRHWTKKALWPLEIFFFTVITMIIVYAAPWSRLIDWYRSRSEDQLKILISEQPKDQTFSEIKERNIASSNTIGPKYHAEAELHTVNTDYSLKKLLIGLPKIGASIERHLIEKNSKGVDAVHLKVSIPKNQTEALYSNLKKQGQLTWTHSPSENEDGGNIFGMELWLLQQAPPKFKPPAKELNEE